jgi:hypothetical protein
VWGSPGASAWRRILNTRRCKNAVKGIQTCKIKGGVIRHHNVFWNLAKKRGGRPTLTDAGGKADNI